MLCNNYVIRKYICTFTYVPTARDSECNRVKVEEHNKKEN